MTDIKVAGMLSRMKLDFVNREAELRELDTAAKRGGLLVVYGRRRLGKTRLLRHWLAARDDLYSQAAYGHAEQGNDSIYLYLGRLF